MALAEKTLRSDQAAGKPAGPPRAVDRSDTSGSTTMVLVVAVVLVGAALFFLMIGRDSAYPYVIGLLALLAVCGVFSLFAYASGILRFASEDSRNDMTKAIVDGAPQGVAVTEASGRVLYASPSYLSLTGASGEDDVRGVERAFTGAPDVSEAIYRLSQAAREGRRHQEEVRYPQADGARYAAAALKAGVQRRQVELQEALALQFVGAIHKILGGLQLTAAQQETAGTLVPSVLRSLDQKETP